MKQIFLFFMIGLILGSCHKNKPETTPIENYSYPTYNFFNGEIGASDNSTLVSFDDNLIICEYSSIIKVSKSGDKIWQKQINAGVGSKASSIAETDNHDLYICGSTNKNYSSSKMDILLIRMNSSGDTIWTRNYGGSESEYGQNIIATSDGNILISGKTESFGDRFGDIYLIKVNTKGEVVWSNSYLDQDQEVPFHLMETQNGEYLVTGTNEDNSNPREIYLLKVNQKGSLLWNKKIGPATWKWGFSTIELKNGDLLTCGKHTILGFDQILLVKTDMLGNVIWERTLGDSKISEEAYSIKQNTDGTFTITGLTTGTNNSQIDAILFKVDQEGGLLWYKRFGSPRWDYGYNLIKDANDDNIITGQISDSIFLTRTDKDGKFK